MIRQKKFTTIVLELKKKTYIVHITSFTRSNALVYLFYLVQIIGLKLIAILKLILKEYVNFADIFLFYLVALFLEHKKINNHKIKSIHNQLLYHIFICSLRFVKLKTFKIYIKINLTTDFIKPFKSIRRILFLFLKKFY